MQILCIGDIVGKPGRTAIKDLLKDIVEEHSVDCVIANAENSAGGSGLSSRISKDLFSMGCDVLTLGDHVWDQKELEECLDKTEHVLRPANFPEGTPGKGWCIKELASGIKVGVINLLGRVFIRYNTDCPFRALERIADELRKETPIIVVDVHAETTSEKNAMGLFADGKVSAVVGTHTHVQTADEKVLPGGTAYITDLGMTGPHDSVIGQEKENIIQRFLLSMPTKFQVAKNDIQLNGAVISIDETTGKSSSIVRIQKKLQTFSSD